MSMNIRRFDEFKNEIRELRKRFQSTAELLESAAKKMISNDHDWLLPEQSVYIALRDLHGAFFKLLNELKKLGKEFHYNEDVGELRALNRIEQQNESWKKNASAQERTFFCECLSDLTSLHHRDGILDDTIQGAVKNTKSLRAEFDRLEKDKPIPRETYEDLRSSEALWKLIVERGSLSTSQKASLSQLVLRRFGMEIVILANAGDLLFKKVHDANESNDCKIPHSEPSGLKRDDVAENEPTDELSHADAERQAPIAEACDVQCAEKVVEQASSIVTETAGSQGAQPCDESPGPSDSEKLPDLPPPSMPDLGRTILPLPRVESTASRPSDSVVSVAVGCISPPSNSTVIVREPMREVRDNDYEAAIVPDPSDNSQSEILPAELRTFDEFCKQHYLTTNDQVAEAWWNADPLVLARRIEKEIPQKCQQRRWSHLWLLCTALENLTSVHPSSPEPPWSILDLEAFAEMVADPNSALSGVDPSRHERLRSWVDGKQPSGCGTDLRIPVFLESMRPSEATFDYYRIGELVGQEDLFGSPELREIVKKALEIHSIGQSPIESIRSVLSGVPQRSPSDLAKDLASERKTFRDEMLRLWNAAGGNLKQTHCRTAWDKFVSEIAPTIRVLFPPENGGETTWNLEEMERQIVRIERSYRKIAKDGDVKYEEKNRANRAAQSIVSRAMTINQIAAGWKRSKNRDNSSISGQIPETEIRKVLSKDFAIPKDPVEAAFVEILRGLFGDSQKKSAAMSGEVWSLGLEDFLQCPDLLGVTTSRDIVTIDQMPSVDVRQIENPVLAVVYLLEATQASNSMLRGLPALEDEIQRRKRFDLLEPIHNMLSPTAQSAERQSLDLFCDQRNLLLRQLHECWSQLVELASPAAKAFRFVHEAASSYVTADEIGSVRSLRFLNDWLSRLSEYGDQQIGRSADVLLKRVESESDSAKKQSLLRHINQRHFADALWELERKKTTTEKEGFRLTMWRDEAVEKFNDPMKILHENRDSLSKEAQDLFDAWNAGYRGGNRTVDKPLRTRFSHLIFASGETAGRTDPAPKGDNSEAWFQVEVTSILNWVAENKLNPCFMPQIKSFTRLCILTPIESLKSSSLVTSLRDQVALEKDRICVVLVPHLPASDREELLKVLWGIGPSVCAAVIDDVDLCRLLNPAGRGINLVLGLLELVLEQKNRQTQVPFAKRSGEIVSMEMFFGRRDVAHDLAIEGRYTFLFSGRELGKSSLLTFVKANFDKHQLSSGGTLRVVNVDLSTRRDERGVLNRIIQELSAQLGFEFANPHDGMPSKCLIDSLGQYCRHRPDEKLLILLDEADLFFESQLEEYDASKEECLSWAMRSLMTELKPKGDQELPAVRFLFSGYRTTGTLKGTWTGASGGLLVLHPLKPEEAATLVRGPFERMGIDVRDVAGQIAWRCGYQPTIIRKFCERLLARCDEKYGTGEKRVCVTSDDVTWVFEVDGEVQEAIRNVTDGNFVFKPLDKIIFRAIVEAFYDRHPLAGIRDLPQELMRKLNEICSDLSWLHLSDPNAGLSQVTAIVEKLVQRKLLRKETRGSEETIFPSFPHHIPILAKFPGEPSLKETIHKYQADLKAKHNKGDEVLRMKSVFPSTAVDRISDLSHGSPESEVPPRIMVLATNWADALNRFETGNLKEVSSAEVLRIIETRQWPCDRANRKLNSIVQSASSEIFERVSQAAESIIPSRIILSGGVDLLRASLDRRCEAHARMQVEVFSLERVSRQSLEWWFSRFLKLELDPGGFDRLMEITSGIPLLVALLDAHFQESNLVGTSLTAGRLESSIKEFREHVGQKVYQHLCDDNSPKTRLRSREIEILKMVVAASGSEVDDGHAAPDEGKSLTENLTVYWDEFFRGECSTEPLSPEDRVAMSVVQRLGFVPIDPTVGGDLPMERFVGLSRKDALRDIVRFIS